MANIGTLLKQEISRLCRREIRSEVASVKKASAGYRRDIAALKRQVLSLHRTSTVLAKRTATAVSAPAALADRPVRFVAKGLRSLRKRLGVSQAALGELVGVSSLTVYNWEGGKTAPSKERLAAIVRLRAMGKREVEAQLKQSTKRPAAKRPIKAKGRNKRLTVQRKRTVRAKRK